MSRERLNIDIDHMITLYQSGVSENQVSIQLGISRPTVRRRLIEFKVLTRCQSEAETLKWSQMNALQRSNQGKNAHDATRGREHSFSEKMLRSQTVMTKRLRTSDYERILEKFLTERGIITTPQLAVGPYNCDLAAFPVAVEVFGGNWHFSGRHLARTPERFRYFFNSGWHILIVHATNRSPITAQTADHVVAFLQEMGSDPTLRRQYRMIGGAGDLLASGSSDDNEISLIPPFTSGRNVLGQYERVPR